MQKRPLLMGIVNATPDSFYLRSPTCEEAIAHGLRLLQEGADLLDIGGESTRPGARAISEEEELYRVLPVLCALRAKTTRSISIDTYKPNVAYRALEAGANFLNDVTGFSHPQMRALAASSGVPLCLMHMQGDPTTMQRSPFYPEGILSHLERFFQERIELLLKAGVRQEQIILDPGIGFGKSVEDNCRILLQLARLRALGFPLLLGISRKSFMGKILGRPLSDLLSTTLALNTMALRSEVEIFRVHDVKEHRDILDLFSFLKTLEMSGY